MCEIIKYTIMKQLQSERTINLLQPLGATQLYLFICAYQKEILTLLNKNSVFSIRWHKKNNDAHYINTNKVIAKYFDDISENVNREIIEHTAMHFNIEPYKSIADFTGSEEWLRLNLRYKYFVRADYKACFDSIYTHTFNWIIGKDVNDAKNFKNGSIYCTMDRVLMNINARTSNGIVVGPEFSRMVAELLLQTIDSEVYSMLVDRKKYMDKDYNVFRFVDDIFIFAESENLANEIISLYSDVARKYLLRLNEEKLIKHKTPFVLEEWLNETNLFANRASSMLFCSREEIDIYTNNQNINRGQNRNANRYLIKSSNLSTNKKTIMNNFNSLICKYEDKAKTIVSYFLGMILNQVERERNREDGKVFRDSVTETEVFNFLELSLYAYSHYPDFNNTEKIQQRDRKSVV